MPMRASARRVPCRTGKRMTVLLVHKMDMAANGPSSRPPRQDANSLVRPQFGEQSFTVTVVGPNQPPQFTRSHYRFLTSPENTAYEGEGYRYVPFLLAPTNRFSLVVDDGPPGLVIIQEGSEPNITNAVAWAVPTNATGHRVILRAIPAGGTTADTVIQEFFLAVAAPAKQLAQPLTITVLSQTPEALGLRWVGGASTYQVQRTTELLGPTDTVWENLTAVFPAAAVNFHADTNAPPARAFYRISGAP